MTPHPDETHHDARPATDDDWASTTLENHWTGPAGTEDPHDGGTHLLDVVAAVDHLARGLRHDFTVWDALDEALGWWLIEQASHTGGAIEDPDPAGEDPLNAHMTQVLDLVAHEPDTTVAEVFQQAIRRWATTMAERFNGGYHWPHPAPRREFPPPAIGR